MRTRGVVPAWVLRGVGRGTWGVGRKGCRAFHRINGRGGLIGPDLDWTGYKNPSQYDYSHLPGHLSAFRWHAAHFQDPLTRSCRTR